MNWILVLVGKVSSYPAMGKSKPLPMDTSCA